MVNADQCHASAALTPERDSAFIVNGAGWPALPVWTGMRKRESLSSNGGLNLELAN
jgi:hypothetical protein